MAVLGRIGVEPGNGKYDMLLASDSSPVLGRVKTPEDGVISDKRLVPRRISPRFANAGLVADDVIVAGSFDSKDAAVGVGELKLACCP